MDTMDLFMDQESRDIASASTSERNELLVTLVNQLNHLQTRHVTTHGPNGKRVQKQERQPKTFVIPGIMPLILQLTAHTH